MPSDANGKNEFFDRLLQRAKELNNSGFEWSYAHGMAWLEERIRLWPSDWGDDLQVLIYGDFEQPKAAIDIPGLGILVHPEKLEGTVIRNAITVLKATVTVKEKSVASLVDAASRVNVFLGAYTLVEWGNSACGWWSWVTHGTSGGVKTKLEHQEMPKAVDGILALPSKVRPKVDAALYWVRQPRNLLIEFYRSDLLRVYSAYWNAFECLVEAIDLIRPHREVSSQEKRKLIEDLLAKHKGKVSPRFIQDSYHEIVNPGFVARASHALRVCFGEYANSYIKECFRLPEKTNRLYEIRNAINHGDIDAENPQELLRVESRLSRLWIIIWGMFGRLIPFPAPLDSYSSKTVR